MIINCEFCYTSNLHAKWRQQFSRDALAYKICCKLLCRLLVSCLADAYDKNDVLGLLLLCFAELHWNALKILNTIFHKVV